MKMKRWRYYIDKKFQNRFIYGFSTVILLVAALSLAVLWLIRENPYNMLPDKASILVNIDAAHGIIVSKQEPSSYKLKKKRSSKKSNKKNSKNKKKKAKKANTYVEDTVGGTSYFPVQVIGGKLMKYNAFDLYSYPILIVSLLNILLVAMFGLFFSHKMAGPIYRIKGFLNNYIATGEGKYLDLRKKDYFKEIAVLLNKAFKLTKEVSAKEHEIQNISHADNIELIESKTDKRSIILEQEEK